MNVRSAWVAVSLVGLALGPSSANADGSERVKRLRIAGWTTTAVGTAAFVGGLSYAAANACDEHSGTCDGDDAFSRQLRGHFVMISGGVLAVGAGMPMLIRSRRLSRQNSHEIAIAPGLTGLTISGRF